jgi:hypothetical protein
MIQQIKDFRRCVDYLETRQDIDGKKFAYYGMSWGDASEPSFLRRSHVSKPASY